MQPHSQEMSASSDDTRGRSVQFTKQVDTPFELIVGVIPIRLDSM